MKQGFKKALVMLLSVAMVFTFMAMPVYADEAEGGITVYLTVSDHGTIATANDGSAMAWREVTVTDIDGDGHYYFDEALVAAHKAYNSEDGYAVEASGWVKKLWGQTNDAGFSFIRNNDTTDLVTIAEIAEGDHLVASSNKDEMLYLDWASFFDKYETEVTAGETFTLNMKGFPAMTKNAPSAAAGMQVGIFKDGAFQAIDGAVTDESGNVSLSFNEPGSYIISASGSASDTVDLTVTYVLQGIVNLDDKAVYGKMDFNTYESWFGYTTEDYGEGPYPYDEIQWMLYMDEDFEIVNDPADFEDGYLLYSGNAICSCPIIAPCCIVNVTAPEPTALDLVLASIDELSNDATTYTADDIERVEAIQAAYEALSAEDQATVDSTFNHPSGDGQSYGRILESALWAVRSYTTDDSTTLVPGTYTTSTTPAVSSESSKGKSDSSRVRNWWVESVEVSADGKATAYIYVTSGEATANKLTSYPSVWAGGKNIARDANNNYAIPVDLNGITYFGGVSSSMPRPTMYALTTTITEPTALDLVLASIDELSNDATTYTADDIERVEAIQAAYEALSAEDQATVDSTFNHPSGDGQSYGRILESALWAVRSYTTDDSTTLVPGTYTTSTTPAVSSESSKGKSDSSRVRNWWVESVEVSADGKATAYIYVTSGEATANKLTSYPSVWAGGKNIARDANNNYAIPVDLNGITYFGGVSSSMPRPTMYALTTTITEPAEPVDVTLTLNNKGVLAADKNGAAVVERSVTVTDLDKDGHLTVDEALVAAHDAYYEGGAAGYATGDPYGYGTTVTKLWGADTTNTLFYVNGEGIPTGVTADEIAAGDSIFASVNADDANYADWYTKFDKTNGGEVNAEDDVTLTLTGHLGMAYTDEEKEFKPLEGIQIGIWNNGEFEPIEGAVTDADGKATFHIGKAGNIIVTAKGTVPGTSWEGKEIECPTMAPYCTFKVTKTSEQKADQNLTATVAAAKGIVSVGKTTTINVEGVMEDAELTFTPAKEGIITVDKNGKVTAKKVGSVQVVVSAAETDNYKAASTTVKVYVVPGATSSVTVSNLATGMKVYWKQVAGATGYRVYRNGSLVTTIKSGTTVSYIDKEANTNGTKYTFKVVAYSSQGTSRLSKSLTTYRVSRPAISSVKNSSAKVMKVTWGKNSKATGYEIMYSTSSSFASGNKTVTVGSASTVSRGIGGLTKGKTYYVKMRTYKTVSGKKYYSAWSVVKTVKITK
ncbi:MAG: hypothetical protein E7229_02685 [Clostridiales bacterium]|nr:hypothetical protein [Clostridiales bacterium]